MSIELLDEDVTAIAFYLSSERLATFHAVAGSDRDVIHLHQRVLAVGAALAPIIAVIEISIRNAICENLRTSFGIPDWLRNPPAPFAWGKEQAKGIKQAVGHAQRAAYAKLNNAEKKSLDLKAYPTGVPSGLGHEKRVKARQAVLSVGNGQVIAQLTLYFWKRLFSKDYENTLWKRSLKGIFPNKTLDRTDVSDALEIIYQARNRIAHHEPIFDQRLVELLEAIEFVYRNFQTQRTDSSKRLSSWKRHSSLTGQPEMVDQPCSENGAGAWRPAPIVTARRPVPATIAPAPGRR
jgi:hypothetical protein